MLYKKLLFGTTKVNIIFLFLFFVFVKVVSNQSVRTLMLQEYSGMTVLSENNVRVPPFGLATSAEEAYQQAMKIGLELFSLI